MKGNKILYYIAGALVLLVLGMIFLKFDLPVVSVSAEKLPHWNLFGLAVTNSLLTSWVVTIFIIVTAYFGTRNMQL
ncbi:MAG: hypothetical protein ACE5G8_12465, partial [Anaerolineae bacterium]